MDGPGNAGWRPVAGRVVEVATDLLGEAVRGVYVHGSAALGGWGPGSDVDMILVVKPPTSFDWTTVGEVFGQTGQSIALEVSVVAEAAARRPAAPWPFLLHVDTRHRRQRLVLGSAMPGDSDLVMHYAVCRTHGLRLVGPPPEEIIGAVPRADVIDYLAAELDWAVAHADARYVVLNACRAHAYAATGQLLSKLDGAHWARPVHPAFAALIEHAHRAQRGGVDLGPPDADTVALVRVVQQSLAP